MKKSIRMALLLLFSAIGVFAQHRTITGKVLNAGDLTPIAGASVALQGNTRGTVTNETGNFALEVPAGAVALIVSYIGYQQQRVSVDGNGAVTVIRLEAATNVLDEVLVTALGITRKTKSLTYSTQLIKGEDLVRVKDVNPMNNLIGRVSGMQVNRNSSGIGGSVNMTLRGFKSNRSNQPLFVVDGLPIANTAGSGSIGPYGGNTDRGDILSTLNADDIASINVLKGASASALYGSQGANGAIMISTKKGPAIRTKIDVSSGVTLDQPFYLPELQYSYGQTTDKNEQSWGEKGSFKDPVKDFFNTGRTWMNTLRLSGGTDKVQHYFSYSNTSNKGVLPASTLGQHTASFRNSANFFDNRLSFNGSLAYSYQDIHNRPAAGLYFNPLSGLYLFPRGLDFDTYKSYEYYSGTRNLYLQNWWNINADADLNGNDLQQNPFWILNRNTNDQTRDNLTGSVSLLFHMNNWLRVTARGTMNKRWDRYERRIYAGTQGVLSGETIPGVLKDNGRYQREAGESTFLYGDLLLSGVRNLSDELSLNVTAGTSIDDTRSKGWTLDARKLAIANIFLLNNLYRNSPVANLVENGSNRQVQSVFGSANLGYKEFVYMDLTARNDWSSTLANTPNEKTGYFYWSAGFATILSELFALPELISYSKLRFSYAEVGNDVSVSATMPTNALGTGLLTSNISGPYLGLPLKPEISRSYELGYEGRFWHDRVSLDLALYRTNTKNQYFSFEGPLGLLNTTVFLNAGNVENKGIEVSLGADVVKNTQLRWNSSLNVTFNRNKVLELAPKLGDRYTVGGNFNVLRVGGSFGDFWAKTFLRNANGVLVVDDEGRPQGGPDGYLGNNNPKAIIGWNNTVSYKNLTLSMIVDGRFGGKVISVTQGYLNSFGVSRESADARDSGGVFVDAVKTDGSPWSGPVNAQNYYAAIGNRDGIMEGNVYGATNIRLREISLSCKLPVRWQGIRQASVGLTGRNLFFFRNDAPYDPELNASTAVGAQGYDNFGPPTTRSYGLNVKVSF